MKKAVFLLGLLMAGSAIAQPQPAEQPFAGLDYTMATLTTSDADLNLDAVRVRVGSELGRYFGIEYQGAVGVRSDEATVSAGTFSARLKGLIGAYARAKLPLGDAVAVYGLAGYSWSWVAIGTQVPGLANKTTNEEDFSAGAGLEARLFGPAFLSVEYMQYTQGLSAVSAGIRLPL